MTEPLHRLPNGSWITLSRITAICVRPPRTIAGQKISADAVVACDGAHYTVLFNDYEAAQAFADELAKEKKA